MKNILVLSVFLSLIYTVCSVTKLLSTFELFCAYRQLPIHDELSGSYVVSGLAEKNIIFQIYSPTNEQLFKIEKEREGQFNILAREEGEYRVCFRNTQRESTFIRFEMSANISEPKTSMMNSTFITGMDAQLTFTLRQLKMIRTNQAYQEFRERVHTDNLSRIESKIGWTTFLKVLVLVGIGAGQAFVLTTLFKKKLVSSSV